VLPPKVEQAFNGRLEEALPDRVDQAVSGHLEETLNGHLEEALAGRLEQALSSQLERALPGHVERALSGRAIEHPMTADLEETVSRRIEEAVAERVERAVAGRLEEALAEARKAREDAEQVARELRVGRSTKPKPLPVGFYGSDGPSEPDRPSLPDFDELSTPLATLSLDGRFMHLNGAFRKLVGYSEEEFASARWPSPAFTEHIGSQRELRRALAAGEVDEAQIETAYMHREGLLVPLVGRMGLVRDEEGVPDHLLFSVGAP
jgi:PAS domain S-box-containing protein